MSRHLLFVSRAFAVLRTICKAVSLLKRLSCSCIGPTLRVLFCLRELNRDFEDKICYRNGAILTGVSVVVARASSARDVAVVSAVCRSRRATS